jgi:ubiquinone/menaquinone biosynthesis C-methylase UbiE
MTATRHNLSYALQKRTAAHYDAFPFEFLTPTDEKEAERLQPAPFIRFAQQYIRPEARVGEVGCGPGRGTSYLCARSNAVIALDLSERSLDLVQKRAPKAIRILGSALALPFADQSFDAVVCDGVIHHTPDARCAFNECNRILRTGGVLYLGVYNRRRYYYYIYTYPGSVVRWLERYAAGRVLVLATIFPVYLLAHFLKAHGNKTLRGARNFFYDYLITPRASFHKREEIESWASDVGLVLADYDPSLGNVQAFVFRKPAQLSQRKSGAAASQ